MRKNCLRRHRTLRKLGDLGTSNFNISFNPFKTVIKDHLVVFYCLYVEYCKESKGMIHCISAKLPQGGTHCVEARELQVVAGGTQC